MSPHARSRRQSERHRFEIDVASLDGKYLTDALDCIADSYIIYLEHHVFCHRYNVLNATDLEDCAQQTRIVYFRKRGTLDCIISAGTLDGFVTPSGGIRGLQTWLSRTFNFMCRKQLHDYERHILVPPEHLARLPNEDEAMIDREELLAEVHKILDRLPNDRRTRFTEHHLLGHVQKDIAARWGMTLGAVKTELHRSRHEIRQQFFTRFGDAFLDE